MSAAILSVPLIYFITRYTLGDLNQSFSTVDPTDPLFVARLAPDTPLQIDSIAHLELDIAKASFFDLATGLAIRSG